VTLDIPAKLPPDEELIRKAIADQAAMMLIPPVSMLGIPAMKKVAREITRWPQELGEERAAASLRQVREYLNSPPDLEGNQLTAGRHLYIIFLREAGQATGLDFSTPIGRFETTVATVPLLAAALRDDRLDEAAALFGRIAEAETEAFTKLGEIIGSGD
jgi:hypothetical protein